MYGSSPVAHRMPDRPLPERRLQYSSPYRPRSNTPGGGAAEAWGDAMTSSQIWAQAMLDPDLEANLAALEQEIDLFSASHACPSGDGHPECRWEEGLPVIRFVQAEALREIEAALQGVPTFDDWTVLSQHLSIVRLEKSTPSQRNMAKMAVFTKEDCLFGAAVVSVGVA